MHLNTFLQDIVDNLKVVEGLQAIVLGGSRASDTQRPDSDIDLGLYYNDHSPLDIDHIRRICIELNDTPDPVVTNIGEWGKWVNGGAWLAIQKQRVDFLYRNIDFVSKILYDPEGAINNLKSKISPYSKALKYNIINKFLWNAEFSLEVARKSAKRPEVYFAAGCLTRIASSLVQVLYALNETYFISDNQTREYHEINELPKTLTKWVIPCILAL
jgi:hypothetical protein